MKAGQDGLDARFVEIVWASMSARRVGGVGLHAIEDDGVTVPWRWRLGLGEIVWLHDGAAVGRDVDHHGSLSQCPSSEQDRRRWGGLAAPSASPARTIVTMTLVTAGRYRIDPVRGAASHANNDRATSRSLRLVMLFPIVEPWTGRPRAASVRSRTTGRPTSVFPRRLAIWARFRRGSRSARAASTETLWGR